MSELTQAVRRRSARRPARRGAVQARATSRGASGLLALMVVAAACASDTSGVAETGTTVTTTTSMPTPAGIEVAAGLNDPENPSLAVLEFMPADITVEVGSAVQWVWQGVDYHSVTFLPAGQPRPPPASDPSLFAPAGIGTPVNGQTLVNSGLVNERQSLVNSGPVNEQLQPGAFATTFASAGDFAYFCAIHVGMSGVVHVVGPGGPSDSPEEVFRRRVADQERWLTAGRNAVRAFRNSVEDPVVGPDGASTWIVKMGETTANNDLLVFAPSTVSARVGDTVRFVNNSFAPHTASFFGTGAAPAVDIASPAATDPTGPSPLSLTGVGYTSTGRLPPDEGAPIADRTFEVRLDEPGVFAYVCLLHADVAMLGTIEVTA